MKLIVIISWSYDVFRAKLRYEGKTLTIRADNDKR